MAITYNAGTNTITLDGANIYSFTDIYNADIAGSWGVVTRQCLNQFCFSCHIVIGDNTNVTKLEDTSKQIIFTNGIVSAGNINQIEIKTNSEMTLGSIISGYITTNGCSIISQETTLNRIHHMVYLNKGKVYLYSCNLIALCAIAPGQCAVSGLLTGSYVDSTPVMKVFNTICSRVQLESCTQADIYNVIITDSSYGYTSLSPTLTGLTSQKIDNEALQLYRMNSSLTMQNLKIEANDGSNRIRADIMTGDAYLIDCEVDVWNFYWARSPYPLVYRQNSFDARAIDETETGILGAGVKIWDFGGVLVTDTTTNATGYISTQTLSFGYYSQPHGNTPTMKTPHTIEISKAGYQSYVTKFTVNKKLDWTLRLLKTQPIQFCEGIPILQLAPESQEDDRILFGVI